MNRSVIFISLVVGWVSYYLCQRTLPSAMTLMIHDGGHTEKYQKTTSYTKGDIGVLHSCFAIAYATSIFINGFLSDRLNPRFLFCFGLVTSSILCLLFPLTEGNLLLGCVVWFVFGLFQGCGWPACVKILRQWYSSEELGTWWSMLSCSSNLSSSLLRYVVSEVTDWHYSFYSIGTATLIMAIPIALTVRSPPTASNMLSNGHQSSQQTNGRHKDASKESLKPLPWYGAFLVFDLWIVAMLYILWWLAKASVMDWGQLYLEDVAMISAKKAATTVSIMEVGNTLGKLTSGPLSVWLIKRNNNKERNGQTSRSTSVKFTMIFFVAVTLMVLLCSLGSFTSETSNELWLTLLFASIGAAVEAGMTLSSLCSMEVVPKSVSGSALGLIIATGQVVGRSLAGWPFSQVVEVVGWNRAYQLVGMIYIVTVSLSGYLMVTFRSNGKLNQKQE